MKRILVVFAQQKVWASPEGNNWYSARAFLVFADGEIKLVRRRTRRTLWNAVDKILDELAQKGYVVEKTYVENIKVRRRSELCRKDPTKEWPMWNYWSHWNHELGQLCHHGYVDNYEKGEI